MVRGAFKRGSGSGPQTHTGRLNGRHFAGPGQVDLVAWSRADTGRHAKIGRTAANESRRRRGCRARLSQPLAGPRPATLPLQPRPTPTPTGTAADLRPAAAPGGLSRPAVVVSGRAEGIISRRGSCSRGRRWGHTPEFILQFKFCAIYRSQLVEAPTYDPTGILHNQVSTLVFGFHAEQLLQFSLGPCLELLSTPGLYKLWHLRNLLCNISIAS